jgi:hypothetical protein
MAHTAGVLLLHMDPEDAFITLANLFNRQTFLDLFRVSAVLIATACISFHVK